MTVVIVSIIKIGDVARSYPASLQVTNYCVELVTE
jgi:hypothetical protein